jgi:hypothetical protein
VLGSGWRAFGVVDFGKKPVGFALFGLELVFWRFSWEVFLMGEEAIELG